MGEDDPPLLVPILYMLYLQAFSYTKTAQQANQNSKQRSKEISFITGNGYTIIAKPKESSIAKDANERNKTAMLVVLFQTTFFSRRNTHPQWTTRLFKSTHSDQISETSTPASNLTFQAQKPPLYPANRGFLSCCFYLQVFKTTMVKAAIKRPGNRSDKIKNLS